jgi:hypothetical protein
MSNPNQTPANASRSNRPPPIGRRLNFAVNTPNSPTPQGFIFSPPDTELNTSPYVFGTPVMETNANSPQSIGSMSSDGIQSMQASPILPNRSVANFRLGRFLTPQPDSDSTLSSIPGARPTKQKDHVETEISTEPEQKSSRKRRSNYAEFLDNLDGRQQTGQNTPSIVSRRDSNVRPSSPYLDTPSRN